MRAPSAHAGSRILSVALRDSMSGHYEGRRSSRKSRRGSAAGRRGLQEAKQHKQRAAQQRQPEAIPSSSSTEIRSMSSTESDSSTAEAVSEPEATPGSSSIPHPDSTFQVWTPDMKRQWRLLSSIKDKISGIGKHKNAGSASSGSQTPKDTSGGGRQRLKRSDPYSGPRSAGKEGKQHKK